MPQRRGAPQCARVVAVAMETALQCKECGQPFIKKARFASSIPSEPNINVSFLLVSNILAPGSQVYSVRIREQGPDYRYSTAHYNFTPGLVQ